MGKYSLNPPTINKHQEHICFKERETEAQKNGFPRVIGDKQGKLGLECRQPGPNPWAKLPSRSTWLQAGRPANSLNDTV